MPTAYEGPRCENTDEMVITGGVEEGGDDKAVAACTQFTEMWTGFQNDETCGDKWYDFTSDEDTTTKAVELCNSCGKEFERFEAFGLQYFAALNNANCPVGDTTVQAFAMMKAAYGTCLTDTDGGESCYEVVQETLSASPPGDSTVSSGGASGTMHEDAVVDEDWTDTPKDGSEGPPPGATRRNDATECLTTCNKWGAAYANMLGISPPGEPPSGASGGAAGTMHEDAVVDEGWTDTPQDGSGGPAKLEGSNRRAESGTSLDKLAEHYQRVLAQCTDGGHPEPVHGEPGLAEPGSADSEREFANTNDDLDGDDDTTKQTAGAGDEEAGTGVEMVLVAELDMEEAAFTTPKQQAYVAAVAAAVGVSADKVAIVSITALAAARRRLLAGGIAVETKVQMPAGNAALPSAAALSTQISASLAGEGISATVTRFEETQETQESDPVDAGPDDSAAPRLLSSLLPLLLAAPSLLAALV